MMHMAVTWAAIAQSAIQQSSPGQLGVIAPPPGTSGLGSSGASDNLVGQRLFQIPHPIP